MLDLEGQGRVEQTSLEDTKGKGPTSRIIKRRNVGTNVWMDGCMVSGYGISRICLEFGVWAGWQQILDGEALSGVDR